MPWFDADARQCPVDRIRGAKLHIGVARSNLKAPDSNDEIDQVAGKLLYTGSADRTAKSWVIEFGDEAVTFKGHKHSISALLVADGICITITCYFMESRHNLNLKNA